MPRIQYHRYSLVPKSGGKPREGALLRVDGGYADLCPLPEFGDGTVDEQLAKLAGGKPTDLVRIALEFAHTDSQYRREGKSFLADFDPEFLPQGNHALLPVLSGYTPHSLCEAVRQLWRQGFRVFKVKLGRDDVHQETMLLNSLIANCTEDVQLRLDPNARFTPESCVRFFDGLTQETRTRIEFIEDPTPFDTSFWRFLYENYHIPIAADFEVSDDAEENPPYQVRVLKPVRDSEEYLKKVVLNVEKIVITSALDHPVGQMQALFLAAIVLYVCPQRVSPVCGIASHLVYEENPFSAQLRMEGSRLIPPPGTGWGFNELLEALPWTDLG